MRKIALLLSLLLTLTLLLTACGGSDKAAQTPTEAPAVEEPAEETVEEAVAADANASSERVELVVFNWFDYIDPDVIDLFEEETGISVQYVNFTTNEEMYTKLEAGAGTYDVIFPSEYMIERMIAHDMLAGLDLDAMPNFANIMDNLKDPSYDPGNAHSVPYMWGTLGYVYNTEMIDEELTSWGALFDEAYSGQVLMMNSMRDTIGLALKYQGHSMNTRDEGELNAAKDLLVEQKQKGIQSGYLLDEIKDKMVGGEAAIGVVYSGDAQYAIDENDSLRYVIPEEGSNIWVDGMCIPKTSKHISEAQMFIDFMCREDIAQMNFDYIRYCSPVQAVADNLSEEEAAMPALNPSPEVIAKCEYFNDVEDAMELYEGVWMEVRLAR